LLMASISEIPFSQTKVASLCYYKVFLFIPIVVTCKYGYRVWSQSNEPMMMKDSRNVVLFVVLLTFS
jgi:hypothetical protein